MSKIHYRSILISVLTYISTVLYSQTANFTMDVTEGCNPLTVKFTNTGSSGAEYTYLWNFGGNGTSTLENPSHTFANPNPASVNGDYEVTLTVTNTSTSATNSVTKAILVKRTPSAKLDIDETNACVHGDVVFLTGFDPKDKAKWDFGDGSYGNESISRYVYHAYKNNGTYTVKFITFFEECSDTSENTVVVQGPIANFSKSQDEACMNGAINFEMDKGSIGVTSFSWEIDGNSYTTDKVNYNFDTTGIFVPRLTVSGPSGSCMIDDTVEIVSVKAAFEYFDDHFCDSFLINIQNKSVGNVYNFWDFGNGNTGSGSNSAQTYVAGTYTIKLKVWNDIGCYDSIQDVIDVKELPTLALSKGDTICKGSSINLSAVSSAQKITWFPPAGLNDLTSFTPIAAPDSSITYYATVTETNTHCGNFGQIKIGVMEQVTTDNIFVTPLDTSIIVGDTVHIFAIDLDSASRDLIFTWMPDYRISCSNCTSPIVQPLKTTTYTLNVTDVQSCFIPKDFTVVINVTEKYIIGVPQAFTPNGDGNNDIIKVDGWGIKQLLEFKIYNRWGTEMFSTDNKETGWDGYFNGKLQSIDSYAFFIKAEMWDDNVVEKKGTFTLIR